MANLYSPGNANRNYFYNLTTSGTAEDAQNRLNQYYMSGSSQRSYNTGGGSSGGGGTPAAYGSGAGGGGYGYASNPGSALGAQYQQAAEQARQANETRYNQLLSGQNELYGRVMASVDQGNSQAVADLSRSFDRQRSAGTQDMISRGLTGSTIQQTMNSGIERNRAESLNRQAADFRRERLGYDVGLTGERLGTIERRTDSYPEMQQLMALAQLQGQGGVGAGSAYGSYGNGAGSYGSAAGTPYAALGGGSLSQLGQVGQIYGGSRNYSNYDGGMSQQQIMALQQQRGYNSGYSTAGVGSYGAGVNPYGGNPNGYATYNGVYSY